MRGDVFHYLAFGLTISSEFEIRQLPEHPEPLSEFITAVCIKRGHVANDLVTQPGLRRGLMRDHFRYQVEQGCDVTVDPLPGTDPRNIADMLMSRVLAIVIYQRQMLLLHASAILINGQVMAFAGPSGAGKSTLAAALHSRGHPIFSDDMFVACANDAHRVIVQPGAARLKLSEASMQSLGLLDRNLPLSNTQEEKYLAGPRHSEILARTEGYPLSTIFVVSDGSFKMRRISAIQAGAHWRTIIRSPDLFAVAAQPDAIWQLWMNLITSSEVIGLDRNSDFSDMMAIVDAVEQIADSGTCAEILD